LAFQRFAYFAIRDLRCGTVRRENFLQKRKVSFSAIPATLNTIISNPQNLSTPLKATSKHSTNFLCIRLGGFGILNNTRVPKDQVLSAADVL